MRRSHLPPTAACLTLLLAACQAATSETPAAAPPPTAVATAPTLAPAAVASPAGRYEATGPIGATLDLSGPVDGQWQVGLRGGARPDGAATAADCELQARGPLKHGRIDAAVVPFEGVLMSVTAADLARAPARVRVTLDGQRALVEAETGLCAMGAEFDGEYRRVAAP